MNITQVLAGQQTNLTLTAYSDGTQTDQGTFTIGIVDANGTAIVASGTAVTDNDDGTYTYTLAAQTDPAFLTATWTETGGLVYTTYVEVVGAVLFTEAAIRAFDDEQLSTSNLNPDDSDIALVRQRVSEWIENETGRSFIPRYCRGVGHGNGSTVLDLSDLDTRASDGMRLHRPGARRDTIEILSATIDGSAVTPTITDDGLVYLSSGWSSSTTPNNVVIEWVYGQSYPIDGVDRIAMMIAARQLKSSRIPFEAESFTDPLGSYQFDPTRLPHEAWAWVKTHRVGAFFA